MAAILILGAKVPFTSGGQEALVKTLSNELRAHGHIVDTVELPYSALPKERLLEQAAQWRSLDLREFAGQEVDLVIATKFPTYYAKHKAKSLWLVHQHRPLYDLYGGRYSDLSDDPRDEQLRRMLVEGDKQVLQECRYVSGISKNVITRLQEFCSVPGEVLYPPLPLGKRYFCDAESEPYVLSVGRLCSIKRVDLMIKAMPLIDQRLKLKIVGSPDEPGIMDYYQNEIHKHHLEDRIEFLGRVSDEELLNLYARCFAVYYAPRDEDYGYVTLEAMASSKTLVTANDSGGVLEFVRHRENGLIQEPSVESIAAGFNELFTDPDLAMRLATCGRQFIEQSGLAESAWDDVVSRLCSPLNDTGVQNSKCASA